MFEHCSIADVIAITFKHLVFPFMYKTCQQPAKPAKVRRKVQQPMKFRRHNICTESRDESIKKSVNTLQKNFWSDQATLTLDATEAIDEVTKRLIYLYLGVA
jgi:hypothetical protein